MIETLQTRLASDADPWKKAWWEAYLKRSICFHGVPMATIRREVRNMALAKITGRERRG